MARPSIARPQSFEEITQAFERWHPERRRRLKFEFNREKRENSLTMRLKAERDVRLEVGKNELSYEQAGSRLQLILPQFDVVMKVEGGYILCEFKTSPSSAAANVRGTAIAAENSKNPIFVARAINAIRGLDQEIPQERIDEASAASTDYQVLLSALTEPSVATQLAVNDPLAKAKLRGVERQQELLKRAGGVLIASSVGKLLGISRQAVHKRQSQGQLIGLTLGRRGYGYPAWQFEGGRTVPQLETVLRVLSRHDPWMQMVFFLGENDALEGKRPVDRLKEGAIDSVLRAARIFGEQGPA